MHPIQITGLSSSLQEVNMQKGEAPSLRGTGFAREVEARLGAPSGMEAVFQEASAAYGIPTVVIKAVAKAESNFNPKARSHCGAQGVMQLMPATARGLGVTDPWDVRQNIMGGTKYLRSMLDKYDGNLKLALAAYNAGGGNVDKYGGVPPFKETQNYVTKIMGMLSDSGISEYCPVTAPRTGGQISGITARNVTDRDSESYRRLLEQVQGFDDFSENDYILLLEMMRLSMSSSLNSVLAGKTDCCRNSPLGADGFLNFNWAKT